MSENTESGTRRLFMNSQSSKNYDDIPLPARQQLGDHGTLKDARSGNGVEYELGLPGQGAGGNTEVTYHLDATEAPAEPEDAPGRPGSARARAADDGSQAGTVQDRFGYRQYGSYHNKTSMRTQPNRDQRIVEERGDHESDVIDVADGGTAGHKMMPQGIEQSASEQRGVYQGRRGEGTPGGGDIGGDTVSADTSGGGANSSGGASATVAQNAGKVDNTGSVAGSSTSNTNSASVTSSNISSTQQTFSTSNASSSGGDSDAVPEGSANDVLNWVGDNKSRAQRALDAEQAKDKPRSGLVRDLNEKLS